MIHFAIILFRNYHYECRKGKKTVAQTDMLQQWFPFPTLEFSELFGTTYYFTNVCKGSLWDQFIDNNNIEYITVMLAVVHCNQTI